MARADYSCIRSSVVRAPAAQAGGPGFDPQWLPRIFSLSAGLY